ncbi:hypothetical protein AHF37_03125 [Paragonimus kellicotti]|nr:hypothetical protein AHF37_03125 [Paragonimus kellicotti]
MKIGVYILALVLRLCAAELRIIEGPSSTFGLENQKIVLRCRIIAGNYSSIKWFHDNAEVTSKHPENKVEVDTSMGEVVSSLSFHLVRSNQGQYFCNVSHSAGWEISKKATVRITYLEENFILEPQDKTVSVGETVLLECIPPTGLPKPTVQWYKDNQSLMKDERMQVSEGGNLRIDRISWKDGGVYWCAAEAFAFRRQSSAAVVTVRYRPYFVESPLSQSVQVHSAFELSCRAAGEPLPTIFWRRDPPFLEIPFERTRLLLKGTLQFTEVRLEDAGDYVCRAVSSSGVIEAIAHINVVSPPGLIQTPPSTVSVLEGERVELLCSALGSPDPDIRWIRKDPLIYYVADANPNYDRIFVSPSGSLIFFSARLEDSSHYECRASSPAGLARSLTFVEVKPNPYLDPARFGALSSGKMYIRLSRTPITVRIVCNFPMSQSVSDSLSHSGTFLEVGNSSAGSLSIVWRVDGDSLYNRFGTSNRTVVEQNGSLVIHNVLQRDEGNYSCLIINHLSRRYTSWTTELFVSHKSNTTSLSRPLETKDLPNPPSNLTVVGVGDTWLAFRWSDRNENGHLVGYKLFYLPIVRGSIAPASSESRAPLGLTLETEYKRDANFAPVWDSWLSTPDVIRRKQARLIRLIPNTGYWVEVRKVNQFGLSPGNIFPRIIYTLEKPSQVKFPTEPSNNTDVVHTGVSSFAVSFIGGNTAVDYQNMLSNFQSITFGDMNVRSLTASEILISWMTRSSSGVLQQIDGFKVNIKPVPMSRCLVVASSSSVGQPFPFTQGRDGMTVFSQSGIQRKSLTSPVHCSLSSDELLEQILRMSTTPAVPNSEESSVYNDTVDPQSPVARTVFATRSVSLINPVTKAIGSGLLPFTCYEVDVAAFKDDLTYGRLWSRSSRPELALTLDASPSHAPRLVTADWLLGDGRAASRNVTTTVSPSTPSGVRLIWKPLELRMAHGALIGYVVHFLANESDHSRSLKVPADLSSKDVFGLSPNVDYMIYMAGITCRGEGVRGPGYPLPSAISLSHKLSGDAIPDQESTFTNDWRFPLWAYGIIVAVILSWVFFGLLISVVARRGALKRRCDSHVDGVPFHSSMKTNTFWHGCTFCHPARIYQRNPRKQHVQVDRTQPPPNDSHFELAFMPATRTNPFEMSNLLQSTTSSKHTSSDLEKTCRELPDVREEDRFLSGAQSTSGSGSRGNPSSRKLPIHPEGLDEPNYLIGDDAEVYANSDPSVVSDPNDPIPRNLTSAGSFSHTGLVFSTRAAPDCHQPSPNRPQLPDSINIPFPVPPTYQYNGFVNSHTAKQVSSPKLCAEIRNFFVPQLHRNYDVQGQKSLSSDVEDVVPPYASCAVLPISHQLQSTTDFSQQYSLQPGIMGQRPIIREPHKKISFWSRKTNKSVSVGETVFIEFAIPPTGLPKPTVQWYKDNQSLMKDERMQVSEGGNLRIDRISWKDGGVYWCAAEAFAFRRQSSAAVVTVRYRPYFVESPLSQSVQVHSAFELSCRAAGEPLPTIFWRRDPPFLEIPFERTRLLLKGTLQFTEVRLEDAGDYVCRAVSSSGVIEAIAHINVVSPPGLIQTPPSTVSVLEGERVELLCSALGSPDPDIRWIRKDPLIYYVADANPNYDRIFVSPSGSLIFFSARLEDSSHYECRASSPAGLARSLTFVEVKPNPYLDPARFGALSSGKMYIRLSRTPITVRIVCNFPMSQSVSDSLSHSGTFLEVGNSSAGSLSIVWRVDGDSLYNRFGTSNRTVVEQNGSLVIHNVVQRDEGNYSCLIINHLSRRYTSWTTELFVSHKSNTTSLSRPLETKDLPNPPSNLTVVGVGDTWLAFRWSDRNENGHLVGYKLFYLPIVRGSIAPASSESRAPLGLTLETEYKRDANFAPVWDSWLSTPDVIRRKQARLIRLIPNTGYWVEVRKVNQFGLSPGNIFPRIIYTLEKPSQVKFPTEPSNNTDVVHTGVSSFAVSFIGGNTAVDYQNMLSNFQSITFGDMNVRSLTASEILISWMTRSSSGVLQQIDGFKVNIKPVPMSRCLVVASSSSVGQPFPFTQGRDGMTVFSQSGIQRKSLTSPVHCSLSSDELLEQILRMSTTPAVPNSEESSVYNDTVDPQSPVARTVFATRSVSLINPVTKAIGSGLLPFTCYEVDVAAFKDDLTYGRLWSRSSRPELALTLDASPSHAPRLVTADWLLGDGRAASRNVTTTVSPSTPSGVRLIWKPLELRMAHGALIGYVVHFLANESDHSRSLKASSLFCMLFVYRHHFFIVS